MARTAGSDAQITGARLREAATTLFARHGYAAVSMRQIAAEVGVQVGALYNYTTDKQTLLLELMRGHLEEVLRSFTDDPTASPEARLEAFVRFHIRFHKDRPDAVFIAYMELRNLTPENFAIVEVMRREYEDRLQSILEAGRAAGVFHIGDSKIATLAIIAMLTGFTSWFRSAGRLGLSEIEQQYLQMVRGALARRAG
jgi:AcrR family transcriptional regulator